MSTILSEAFIQEFGTPLGETFEELKFTCPECNHKGLYANKGTGLYHCFHCGLKGKKEGAPEVIQQRVVNQGLQREIIHMVVENCTLDKSHRKYLLGRGVFHPEFWKIVTVPFRIHQLLLSKFTQTQVEEAGLSYHTARGNFALSKFLEPRRILIPFWSGDTIVGAKSRANPFDPDVEPKHKYLNAPGGKVGQTLFFRGRNRGDFILTEGELKAIVAHELGFNVAATPGMAPSASAISTISRIVNAPAVQRFFIVYDTSPALWEEWGMLKSLFKLSALCPKKSCIVTFPLRKGQDKEDLDSYLIENGANEFDNLLEDAWVHRARNASRLKYALDSSGITLHGNNKIQPRRTPSNSANKA